MDANSSAYMVIFFSSRRVKSNLHQAKFPGRSQQFTGLIVTACRPDYCLEFSFQKELGFESTLQNACTVGFDIITVIRYPFSMLFHHANADTTGLTAKPRRDGYKQVHASNNQEVQLDGITKTSTHLSGLTTDLFEHLNISLEK